MNLSTNNNDLPEGILLVNKPKGQTSFSLVATLRKRLSVKKIGHTGTLDPFATGVMVLLVGRKYTRLSDQFLATDKTYLAQILLGITTDTYDCDGAILSRSNIIPSMDEINTVLLQFQGEIDQVPPMYSAKKVQGKKLYELARQGKEIPRSAVKVKVKTELIRYEYPYLYCKIDCSKGTYIRSIAQDIGQMLGCGAYLSNLERIQSGTFHIKDCIDGHLLKDNEINIRNYLFQL